MKLMDILKIIAQKVQAHYGEMSLNELIAEGIAVYLEIAEMLPSSRGIDSAPVDGKIILEVLKEIKRQERQE